MIRIHPNDAPHTRLPRFLCDAPLASKLNAFSLFSTMNKYHTAAFIGRAGSGKTSSAVGMLCNKQLFREVFDLVLVCMPATSRASMSDDPFKELPEEQVFDELTLENLQQMEKLALAMSKRKTKTGKERRTLMLFDDVQVALKVPAIQRLMVHLNSNRRHRKTCLWFCVQNYEKLPKQLRMGLTNMFLFSISRNDLRWIHEELLEIPEPVWERVCLLFKQHKSHPGNAHSFLYWSAEPARFYLNYDELELPPEDAGVETASHRKEDDSDDDEA